MIAILFAFITFIVWGTGDIFTTTAVRKIGSYNASFYGYFFGLLAATFFIPFANSIQNFSLPMILLTIFLAIIELLAFYAYNESLKTANSSLVGTISGSFTSLVVIFSVIFLGERLTSFEVISVIVIFIGLFLSSIHFSDLKAKKSVMNRGIVLALLAMVGWGIYFTFIKISVKQAGFFWPTYVSSIVGSAFFLLFGFRKIKIPKVENKSGFPAIFIAGILLEAGSFCFNFAIGKGYSSIVASIAGAYPALFALLAYFIFKDPIRKQQKVGMITTLVGILLLSYFSNQ